MAKNRYKTHYGTKFTVPDITPPRKLPSARATYGASLDTMLPQMPGGRSWTESTSVKKTSTKPQKAYFTPLARSASKFHKAQ